MAARTRNLTIFLIGICCFLNGDIDAREEFTNLYSHKLPLETEPIEEIPNYYTPDTSKMRSFLCRSKPRSRSGPTIIPYENIEQKLIE